MLNKTSAITTSIAALVLTLPATAALTITSSDFSTATNVNQVISTNNVAAVNFTNTAGSVEVNGLTFTNQTADDSILDINAGTIAFESATANYSTSGDAERVAGFDGLYDGRVTNSTSAGGNEVLLKFTGLDITKTYTVQMFYGGADGQRTNTAYHTSGNGSLGDVNKIPNTTTVFGSGTNTLAGIYTTSFTTDDGNATFIVKRSGPSTGNGILNAYSLSAVPEPSSTALLGLGGLALILRRRK